MKRILTVKEINARSTKAICATAEREVRIKKENLSSAIRKLKNKGYMIIGTSYGKTPTKKLWYIKRGLAGL